MFRTRWEDVLHTNSDPKDNNIITSQNQFKSVKFHENNCTKIQANYCNLYKNRQNSYTYILLPSKPHAVRYWLITV